jgi:hypothetical protein
LMLSLMSFQQHLRQHQQALRPPGHPPRPMRTHRRCPNGTQMINP